MRYRNIAIAIAILAWIATSCAPASPNLIKMNVKAYIDPDKPPLNYCSFSAVSIGATEDPLLEKELLHLVKTRLIAMGMSNDDSSPNLLVGLSAFIGSYDTYIPPSTVYWPIPSAPTRRTMAAGIIGEYSVSGTVVTKQHETKYVPVTTPGYTLTQYYRVINIYFAQADTTRADDKVQVIWSGTVDSSGQESDLLKVAPPMIDELLGEYPQRSGKPTIRTTTWPPTDRKSLRERGYDRKAR